MNRFASGLGVSLLLTSNVVSAATAYKMVNLGVWTSAPRAGSTALVPLSFTSDGQVLGFVPNATGLVLKSYNPADGSSTEFFTTTGAAFSTTTYGATVFPPGGRVNQLGQIVGRIAGSSNIFVRNPDGSQIDLGRYPSTTTTPGVAWGINDSGKVFGNVFTGTLDSNTAFVGNVNTGTFKSIGSFYHMTNAYDMNARGQVVGRSGVPLRSGASIIWHAFVTTDTGLQDLHAPSMPVVQGRITGSTANAINDDGLAVGEYPYQFAPSSVSVGEIDAQMHAVVWDTNLVTYADLGKPNTRSTLRDIANNGDAVGAEWDTGDRTGYLTAAHGIVVNVNAGLGGNTMTDLNTRIYELPAGWTINRGDLISNNAMIVAVAKSSASNVQYKVLLVPTSLPVDLPAAPSNLNGTPLSGSQIKLDWLDNATNETAQVLERCTGPDCLSVVEIPLGANVTNYTDVGLTSGVAYKYRIRARGTAGNSLYSNAILQATFAPPAAPTNIAITGNTRSQISISWQDNSSNETGFQVERCRGSGCVNFSQIATVPANTIAFTNTGLTRRTSYSYRVRSFNANGSSAPTGSVSVETLP